MLAMPFARFYTRSLYDDMKYYKLKAQSNHAAARNGERVRLSHQCIRDLKAWRKLTASERLGRSIHPQASDGTMHTDAADVGCGATLGITGNPGDAGLRESQGVRGWKNRAQCITVRELRAVRSLLQGRPGQKTRQAGMIIIRSCVDNTGVVAVTNAFVSSSPKMMPELRKLKRVLDSAGLQIITEWLPSRANRFADALSRRLPIGDFQIREQLTRSVVDEKAVPI
jgi:hypothetical protein